MVSEITETAINRTVTPIKKTGVTIREEMEECGKYMLFNAENELILIINSTGKYILDNCDGEKTISQLIEAIRENYSVDESMNLPEIVENYIKILLEAKLVNTKGEENTK